MVPLTLFKSRSFAGANLVTLFIYAAVGAFFFLFPLNLIQVQGYSPSATGAAILPMILLMFSLSRWAGGLVSRYGPSGPLVIGPLIAAAGFILFALPAVGGNYWTTFFPAIIVLGFGMTITVAPLTTVVMGSADEDHAGTASGINNAVARIAGVLAIAVLGIVMLRAFSFHLDRSLAALLLPPAVMHDIQANEIKLAGLQAASTLAPSTQADIKTSVGKAFVFGFRIVLVICALLAAAGALVARMLIGGAKELSPGIAGH